MKASFARVLRGFASYALACLLLAGVCASPAAQALAPIPALTSPVIDTTGTLDAQSRARLEQQALALQQRKGSQLQILMVPTTQPEDVAAYAQRAFDQWKLGREKVDDAVLVVVAKDDRTARIHTGYGLEGAIPDITAGRVIQEYMVPRFREGDYAGGLEAASAQLVKLIDGEPLPEPMSGQGGDGAPMTWPVGIFIAFFAAMFARGFVSALSRFPRTILSATGAGGIALFFSGGIVWIAVVAAVIGFLLGVAGAASGRYVRHSSWGGFGGGGWGGSSGGSSGGDWSGGGGGGWSGGGGSSGGGGASGSW